MANSNTGIIALVVIGASAGAFYWIKSKEDKTPVGLVVSQMLFPAPAPLGQNSDEKPLSAMILEGTWRKDEDSLSVASVSEDEPLLVIYEEGSPIAAKLVKREDYDYDMFSGPPDECCETAPCEEIDEDYDTDVCWEAIRERTKNMMKKWREVAEEYGATEESLQMYFPQEEESTTQEAESIFGPMMTLQSHFVW